MHVYRKDCTCHMPLNGNAYKMVSGLFNRILDPCYAVARTWPLGGDRKTGTQVASLPRVLINKTEDIIRDYLFESDKEEWIQQGLVKVAEGRWFTLLRQSTKKALEAAESGEPVEVS